MKSFGELLDGVQARDPSTRFEVASGVVCHACPLRERSTCQLRCSPGTYKATRETKVKGILSAADHGPP